MIFFLFLFIIFLLKPGRNSTVSSAGNSVRTVYSQDQNDNNNNNTTNSANYTPNFNNYNNNTPKIAFNTQFNNTIIENENIINLENTLENEPENGNIISSLPVSPRAAAVALAANFVTPPQAVVSEGWFVIMFACLLALILCDLSFGIEF
jgi:hypothetical protein